MCDYQGHEFGASYPDSVCIDGRLYDADNCDDKGNLYGDGEFACPRCNTGEFLAEALEDAQNGGCGRSGFYPHCAAEQWDRSILKAIAENEGGARSFLATVEPFETDDWPDRSAVHANPHLWSQTVRVVWTTQSIPQPQPKGDVS